MTHIIQDQPNPTWLAMQDHLTRQILEPQPLMNLCATCHRPKSECTCQEWREQDAEEQRVAKEGM